MSSPSKNPLPLIITPGDRDGIGPEITCSAIKRSEFKNFTFIVIGSKKHLKKWRIRESSKVEIISPPPGSSGFQCGWAIEQAVGLIKSGQARGMITGPLSKKKLNKAGYHHSGHTEMLAHLTKTPRVTMMLANKRMRVCLATTHLALADVSKNISVRAVSESLQMIHWHLIHWWKVRHPKIAVLSLNPHCGEGGLLGTEESRIILPALKKLPLQVRSSVLGPFPADTFFAQEVTNRRFDAVLSMYHDQGLAPVKMIDFKGTVNVTLGLPFVRTSVDHGVAYDIAGKGVADPSSMIAAIKLAHRLTREKGAFRNFGE